MRLPRDLSGDDLVRRLGRFGYFPVRQTGSHLRLVRDTADGTHRITVPRHSQLRLGTLNQILRDVAEHLGLEKEELIRRLLN